MRLCIRSSRGWQYLENCIWREQNICDISNEVKLREIICHTLIVSEKLYFISYINQISTFCRNCIENVYSTNTICYINQSKARLVHIFWGNNSKIHLNGRNCEIQYVCLDKISYSKLWSLNCVANFSWPNQMNFHFQHLLCIITRIIPFYQIYLN